MNPVAGDIVITRKIQQDAVIVVRHRVIPNAAVRNTYEMDPCGFRTCAPFDCEPGDIHVISAAADFKDVVAGTRRLNRRHRRAVIGANRQAFSEDLNVLGVRAVAYDDGVTTVYTLITDGMLDSLPRVISTSIACYIVTTWSDIKISRARHGNQGDEQGSNNNGCNYPHPCSVYVHLSADPSLLRT